MVVKKAPKSKKEAKSVKTAGRSKVVKAVNVKSIAKTSKNDTNKKGCKIKLFVSKSLGFFAKNRKKIIYAVLALFILGFAPMYCYTAKKIAEGYENSEGYRRAIFGWLKVVMSKKPNEKIKLEGDNLKAYNEIKDYALKISNVYPSLRNLQIKASILTPVDPQGAIKAYQNIINRAGKYKWCPICKGLIINKAEKNNYRYYFEIAKLYEKLGNTEKAMKNIDISIKKFKATKSLDGNKKISDMLMKKQVEIVAAHSTSTKAVKKAVDKKKKESKKMKK